MDRVDVFGDEKEVVAVADATAPNLSRDKRAVHEFCHDERHVTGGRERQLSGGRAAHVAGIEQILDVHAVQHKPGTAQQLFGALVGKTHDTSGVKRQHGLVGHGEQDAEHVLLVGAQALHVRSPRLVWARQATCMSEMTDHIAKGGLS